MGRGTGKGKRGGGRGGGQKMFVANIEEMQMRESQVSESRRIRAERRGQSDDEDSGDQGGDNIDNPVASEDHEATIEKMAQARKKEVPEVAATVEGEPEETVFKGLLGGLATSNPNEKAARKNKERSIKDLDDDGEVVDQEAVMSRREREALEEQRRKEEYMKRHLAGETEAAKKGLYCRFLKYHHASKDL